MSFTLYSYVAYKTSKITYMYTHSFFNFLSQHFVFSMISCTFFVWSWPHARNSYKNHVPDFTSFFGGPHKNIKLEFDCTYMCTQYMTYFKILLFPHYSFHIYWIMKVHCTGSFQEIRLIILHI
jgi:hypothetical protein